MNGVKVKHFTISRKEMSELRLKSLNSSEMNGVKVKHFTISRKEMSELRLKSLNSKGKKTPFCWLRVLDYVVFRSA